MTITDIDQLEDVDIKKERYIGDTVDLLWNSYFKCNGNKKLKVALKSMYNEVARSENKRQGKEEKYHYRLL